MKAVLIITMQNIQKAEDRKKSFENTTLSLPYTANDKKKRFVKYNTREKKHVHRKK